MANSARKQSNPKLLEIYPLTLFEFLIGQASLFLNSERESAFSFVSDTPCTHLRIHPQV